KRGERVGFFAALDDGDARARVREDERGGAGAGDRDVYAYAAIGRFAPQLVGDGARRTEQSIERGDVNRDDIVVVPFIARPKFARDRVDRHRGVSVRRRWSIQTREIGRAHV